MNTIKNKKYFLKKLQEKKSKKELEELEKFLAKESKKLEKNILEKKDEEIIITDLDDTIFSAFERFIFYPELKKLRGEKGNKYIIENIGFEKFIDEMYKNKTFPDDIVGKMTEKDLILTAGMKELQLMKIKELKLEKFNCIITKKAEEKILELIKYIFETLKFFPKKITIYEDRPHFFIFFKDFLEKILNTKIEIIYVEMDGNDIKPKLQKIEF